MPKARKKAKKCNTLYRVTKKQHCSGITPPGGSGIYLEYTYKRCPPTLVQHQSGLHFGYPDFTEAQYGTSKRFPRVVSMSRKTLAVVVTPPIGFPDNTSFLGESMPRFPLTPARA